MRVIPGTVAIIIALLFFPLAYPETLQTTDPLARQSSAEEGRMIRESHLENYVTIKVTTTNQKKFDSNHDGYLSGKELYRYLKHYSR